MIFCLQYTHYNFFILKIFLLISTHPQAPYNTVSYDIIGDDAAPTYFTINSVSGVISIGQSIASDPSDRYTVREG